MAEFGLKGAEAALLSVATANKTDVSTQGLIKLGRVEQGERSKVTRNKGHKDKA